MNRTIEFFVLLLLMFGPLSCNATSEIQIGTPDNELRILVAPSKTTAFLTLYITSVAEKYGVEPELALAIIKCESQMKTDAIGTKAVVGKDYGLLQVNSYWHRKTMEKMGLDIERPSDSLEYGMMLLAKEGTRHWDSSKYCWSKEEKPREKETSEKISQDTIELFFGAQHQMSIFFPSPGIALSSSSRLRIVSRAQDGH